MLYFVHLMLNVNILLYFKLKHDLNLFSLYEECTTPVSPEITDHCV